MIVQFVRFKSALTFDEVLEVANARIPEFRAIDGLTQKYYVKLPAPDSYGGIYIWRDRKALDEYRRSDLFASIPSAYQIIGAPDVEIFEGIFPLRD